MAKVGTPKGTRDFPPEVVARREYLFETLKKHFRRFGFAPLETPSMENLSVLTGKYGEEGDRLIFKILNSGDYLSKLSEQERQTLTSGQMTSKISEKALRYDLTVPFARFVSQNHGTLTFPFKRYQVQNVWRAERPQKGRYREFTQCDCDVVGDDSLLSEVELLQVYEESFQDLGINDVVLQVNNRKILAAYAEVLGASEKLTDLTIAIDKLDKIGKEKVAEELDNKGFSKDALAKIQTLFKLSEQDLTNTEVLQKIEEFIQSSDQGQLGLKEMREILSYAEALELKTLKVDPLLARGLDYYTGTIVEVKLKDSNSGSLGGGGRYDDLTGIFGVKGLSGVGISFGADRIYNLMEERDLFPSSLDAFSEVLLVNFGEESLPHHLKLAKKFRHQNIRTEIYPSSAKMKKQMKYANNKSIPFVILQGEEEIKNNQLTVKEMETGEQKTMTPEEFIQKVQS